MLNNTILLLNPNNETNYKLAKNLSVNQDIKLKCLIFDENISNISDSIKYLVNLYDTRFSFKLVDTQKKNYSEVKNYISDCDNFFLDTYYGNHQKPNVELRQLNYLSNILTGTKNSNIIITTFENCSEFSNLEKLTKINNYYLPQCESRSIGVKRLTDNLDIQNNKITYLYPSLFYDQLFKLFNLNNQDYTIRLPLPILTPIYTMSRDSYVLIISKLLMNPNFSQSKKICRYKLTEELLNIQFIINILNKLSPPKITFSYIELEQFDNFKTEWFNYLTCLKNNSYCSSKSKNIVRDIDTTRFLLDKETSLYEWLKINNNYLE